MVQLDSSLTKLQSKYYCKKNFYSGIYNIFTKGLYYDAYSENESVQSVDDNSESKTIWVIYNYYGGVGDSGYRFWITPSDRFWITPSDGAFTTNKFSDYFLDIKEVRRLKLEKLNESDIL